MAPRPQENDNFAFESDHKFEEEKRVQNSADHQTHQIPTRHFDTFK